uniref:Uncharacterized protein n=1 Tax=Utricularia reniformis TaxID=192314 RepID=A0A1Y0B2J5_9LAMI|nr:hypothetical protein AEK19_MT1428 [Utricularia reniformis]ART31621.1 hypothetical protein AEK19_MT1428 [Utricularia reniformis]
MPSHGIHSISLPFHSQLVSPHQYRKRTELKSGGGWFEDSAFFPSGTLPRQLLRSRV